MLFSSRVRVRVKVRDRLRVRVRVRFSVRLASDYAHVFVQLSVTLQHY